MQAERTFVYFQAALGNNSVAVANSYWYDIAARSKGQVETTLFVWLKPSINAPGALRENEHGRTVFYFFCCILYTLNCLSWIFSFYADVPGPPHGNTEKREPHQFLLQDKLEIHRKAGQQCKDIEIALMICHINAWEPGIDVFLPFSAHLDSAYPKDGPGPRASHIIMYETAIIIKKPQHNGPDTENYCVDEYKGV